MNLKHVLREYMHWYYLFLRGQVVQGINSSFEFFYKLLNLALWWLCARISIWKYILSPDILVTYKQKGWVVIEIYLDVHEPTTLFSISWQPETEEVLFPGHLKLPPCPPHVLYTWIAQSNWRVTAWGKHNIALNHFWGVLTFTPQYYFFFQLFCPEMLKRVWIEILNVKMPRI